MNAKHIFGDSVHLPKDVEDQILQNVFAKCGRLPNSIPLEALSSYSGYRSERYGLLRAGIAIVLLMFILLPLLFISSKIDIHQRTDTAGNRRAYNVTVDGWIPIKKITAEMNGDTVPLYEAAGREYLMVPGGNGTANIEVTLKNGQRTKTSVEVTGIDLDGPEVAEINYDSDFMYVTLSDASEIDFDSAELTAEDGSTRTVAGIDKEKSMVILAYPKENLLLSICDQWQNRLQVQLNASA